MLSNLAGKKHTKKAVQEAAQQKLALDKGQKINNKSQKVNENKLDLDKENVDHQLNQEEKKSSKCIFCGEIVGKHNWQTHIETNHADKISQEKVGNLATLPESDTAKVPQKCALCSKIISSPDNMKSHIEIVHGSKNEMIGHENNLKSQTGKSMSEALILGSTNPQYDKGLFIDLPVQYMKTTISGHVVYTNWFLFSH